MINCEQTLRRNLVYRGERVRAVRTVSANSSYRNREEELKALTFTFTFYGLAAGLLLLTASPSHASVLGDLQTGGVGTVTVTATSIQFTLNDSNGFSTEVGAGSDLTFAGCSTGLLGTPGCLTLGEGITINGGAVLTATGAAEFLTFQSNPSLVYNLTGLDDGSSNTNCAASPCSVIAGSHIILFGTPDGGTDAILGITGFVSDDGFATEDPYRGHFSATIAGLSPLQVQAVFLADQTFTHTYSGDFVASAVPEPRLVWMAALAGMLVVAKKRQKQA
jgi:hypothetical protein